MNHNKKKCAQSQKNKQLNCDKKTSKIINGYIHETQKLFAWKENSYFMIPDLINHICLSFYWIRFAFNREFVGRNLKFINHTRITKINSDRHSLCAIGEAISRELCDIFRIEYHLKKEKGDFCPYIGFFKLKSIDSTCNISWNADGGFGDVNKEITVGIAIYKNNKNVLNKYPKIAGLKDKFNLNETLKSGDKFILEFDFIKSQCHIYHNDKKLNGFIKFKCSHIIPAVQLYFKGEIIEITKYEFNYAHT